MSQALVKPETPTDSAPDAWAIRGDYWTKRVNPTLPYKAHKRRIIHKPLVLSGHGIRLNVNAGTLLITCGFTHYPQKREEYRFFPRDRQLPSRIVILDGDGSITIDALTWLSEQGVALVQIDWRGKVSSIGNASYAANPKLVKRQLAMQDNGEGFAYSKWLIQEKIKHSSQVIHHLSEGSVEAQSMLEQLKRQTAILKKNPPKTIRELLTVEAIAAAAYFRYWNTLSIRWKGISRKPIPPEWFQIVSRTGRQKDSNQYAIHPVNAILNYAYAVLENQIKGQVLATGGDPTIGYMHASNSTRPSLVLDLMEPVRPIMERKILEFVLSRTFSPDDFILNKNGVVRLHPQMARFIVKLVHDIPEIEKITAINLKKLFSRNISR